MTFKGPDRFPSPVPLCALVGLSCSGHRLEETRACGLASLCPGVYRLSRRGVCRCLLAPRSVSVPLALLARIRTEFINVSTLTFIAFLDQ